MRIAYITMHWPRYKKSGVGRKIIRQMDAWRKLGHQVELFTHMHAVEDESILVDSRRFIYKNHKGLLSLLLTEIDRIVHARKLIRSVISYQPDIIFFRWSMYIFPIHRLFKRIPTVIEINSVDVYEYKFLGLFYNLYNRLSRGMILSSVSGINFISEEICQMPFYTRFKKPSIAITNGIDLSSTPLYPAPKNPIPHLLFIGTPGMAWHGVEKLVALAYNFPNLMIDIVGIGAIDGFTSLPSNLTCHGYLSDNHLDAVMKKADAAIGSLSLHLLDLNIRSTLKIPDCAARGIPCILPHIDPDLSPLKSEYFLQIPNAENNIETHGQKIHDFVYAMVGKRVPRDLIADRIGLQKKESARLHFFQEIIKKRDK